MNTLFCCVNCGAKWYNKNIWFCPDCQNNDVKVVEDE